MLKGTKADWATCGNQSSLPKLFMYFNSHLNPGVELFSLSRSCAMAGLLSTINSSHWINSHLKFGSHSLSFLETLASPSLKLHAAVFFSACFVSNFYSAISLGRYTDSRNMVRASPQITMVNVMSHGGFWTETLLTERTATQHRHSQLAKNGTGL